MTPRAQHAALQREQKSCLFWAPSVLPLLQGPVPYLPGVHCTNIPEGGPGKRDTQGSAEGVQKRQSPTEWAGPSPSVCSGQFLCPTLGGHRQEGPQQLTHGPPGQTWGLSMAGPQFSVSAAAVTQCHGRRGPHVQLCR